MTEALPTLDEVKAEVQRIDPTLTEGHRYFKTAVFLVAAFKGVGQSDVALHRFTGYSRGWLIRRIRNLRKSGIWRDGVFTHRWYDEGFGPVEFRLDIKTAEGEMTEDVGAEDERHAQSQLAAMEDESPPPAAAQPPPPVMADEGLAAAHLEEGPVPAMTDDGVATAHADAPVPAMTHDGVPTGNAPQPAEPVAAADRAEAEEEQEPSRPAGEARVPGVDSPQQQ